MTAPIGRWPILAGAILLPTAMLSEARAQIPAVGSTPPPGFERLWPDTEAAFQAHYQRATNCDAAGMRVELAKLENASRGAQQRARGMGGTARAERASEYAATIEALRQAALAQPPLNCPGSQRQLPPCKKIASAIQECPIVAAGPVSGVRFTPPDETAARLLAAQNHARAEDGVPPLVWDRDLAASAAAYGPTLTQLGRPVHASQPGRNCPHENLLQSARGGRTLEQMIAYWVGEKRNFVPGVFPNVSRTGKWSDVAHYTQVVWRTTTRVGCAVHSDQNYDWLICRYSAPGNIDGRPVF